MRRLLNWSEIHWVLILFTSIMLGKMIASRSRLMGVQSAKLQISSPFASKVLMYGKRQLFSTSEKLNETTQNDRNFQNLTLSAPERIEKLVASLKPSMTVNDPSLHLYETSNLRNNSLVAHLSKLFYRNERVNEEYLDTLLDMSIEMMSHYPNVVEAKLLRLSTTGEKEGSLNICGDTHGQYEDFTEIFTDKVGGFPSESNRFIFNGDIADRGPKAIEIFATLLTMKLINPDVVHILRGNHETEEMASRFGFREEVHKKYSLSLLRKFYRFFTSLPVAAVAEDSIFVVHGGLGPNSCDLTIEQMNNINRLAESDNNEVISELLWADPRDNVETFATNHDRGGGILFGPTVTNHFLVKNKLHLLVRSHELQDNGICTMHNNRCVTVFSAPNYCGVCKNKGAILKLSNVPQNITTSEMQTESDAQRKSNLQLSAVLFDAKKLSHK